MASFTARDIKALSGIAPCEIFGDAGTTASGLAALDQPNAAGNLSFCTLEEAAGAHAVAHSGASIILCCPSVAKQLAEIEPGRAVLAVTDPRLAFSLVAAAFCAEPPLSAGVHPSALVDESAALEPTAHIGARAMIGPQSAVGERSVIGAGVVLHRKVRIGRDCRVRAGAVLGVPGFGYCRAGDGALVPFPQIGGVVIGDGVEIGANACVDSGALIATRIGAGSRLDDLVYIAHNVDIGRNCLIMAGVIVCGSARIGDRAELSPGAVVRDKIRVGADARVGLGAVVVADVADGETVAGVPARAFNRPVVG